MDRVNNWEEIWSAYVEGYCGLVCPFPRLLAMRASLSSEFFDTEEYVRLSKLENEYYARKLEAKLKFIRLVQEAQHGEGQ